MVAVSVGERPWPVGRVQERHFLGRGQHPRSASHHRRAGGGSCCGAESRKVLGSFAPGRAGRSGDGIVRATSYCSSLCQLTA